MKTIVALLLIALEPLHFAGELLAVLPTIAYRGWVASIELALHAGVAAFCVMAGFALLNKAPDAQRVASAAVVVLLLRVVQSTYASALPGSTVPGHELLRISMAAGASLAALVVIRRA